MKFTGGANKSVNMKRSWQRQANHEFYNGEEVHVGWRSVDYMYNLPLGVDSMGLDTHTIINRSSNRSFIFYFSKALV